MGVMGRVFLESVCVNRSGTLIISIGGEFIVLISIFKCNVFSVGDCTATAPYNVLSRIQMKRSVLIGLLIRPSVPLFLQIGVLMSVNYSNATITERDAV